MVGYTRAETCRDTLGGCRVARHVHTGAHAQNILFLRRGRAGQQSGGEILLSGRLPFYLETGLAFTSRGGKFGEISVRPSYLQIPVLINYHFNIRDIVTIQPFAGLYYGLGIGGKFKDKESGAKIDAFSDEGGLKRSDLGVRLGAGVVWQQFYFGLGYDIGCLNVAKETGGEGSLRNSCFTLSVGYNF